MECLDLRESQFQFSPDKPHIEFVLMSLIGLLFFQNVMGKNCISKVTVRMVLVCIAHRTAPLSGVNALLIPDKCR